MSRAGAWLLVPVAAALAVVQLALGPLRLDYGWDETVYVSQVARHVPAAFFTAPRARGVTLLVAPIAAFTTNPDAVRVFLIAVSAVGLVLAFRVWLPVLGARSVVVAAAIFASLWQVHVYASEVYPNYWIGLFAVASVGWAARAGSGRHLPLYASGACLAAVTLLRPGDAGWLWLALVIGARSREPWRTARLARSSTVALAIGLVPWLVEAQLHYGGILNRLGKSSATEGGLFPHLGFLYEARAAYGPLLCRPCTTAAHPLWLSLWWVAGAALALWGLSVHRARESFAPLALATASAASLAAPYMLLVGYSAPRFLLPAYAVGSVPVGHALVHLVLTRRRKLVATGVAVGLLLGFAVAEAAATRGITAFENARRDNYRLTADALHANGISAPCLVVGRQAPPIGFEAGCSSEGREPVLTDPNDQWSRALVKRYYDIAVLVEPGQQAPAYVAGWPSKALRLKGTTLTVYLRDGGRRRNVASVSDLSWPPPAPSARPGSASARAGGSRG
jgi:hypothetical protein